MEVTGGCTAFPQQEDCRRLVQQLQQKTTFWDTYEWLGGAIVTCAYIAPGHKFYDIKMGTIALLRRTLGPGGSFGGTVEDTLVLLETTWASELFGNVAGARVYEWHTTNINGDF